MCSWTLLGGAIVFALFNSTAKPQEPPTKSGTQPDYTRLIPSLNGADLFRAHCAPCHGADGTGNGPVAPALSSRLSDLTTLSRRNGGIFPRARVQKIIAGDDEIVAHGSREMPIWGPIFHQIEMDRDYGQVRLTNVTKHIESIQQK
ncbi:MAG TPA: c-type cytochrome [Candidatus Angelobacter sp.]|nr:c-type cytochrome [Candidatus Angelobacter sp.]